MPTVLTLLINKQWTDRFSGIITTLSFLVELLIESKIVINNTYYPDSGCLLNFYLTIALCVS